MRMTMNREVDLEKSENTCLQFRLLTSQVVNALSTTW